MSKKFCSTSLAPTRTLSLVNSTTRRWHLAFPSPVVILFSKRCIPALWRLSVRASSTATSTESFFRHTSGRWLHDQERHQALRYRRFNVDALKEVVTRNTEAPGVVNMSKIGEGRCNKVFRVQLEEGHPDVIARIPMPVAGLPHSVTASEVATMTFLRDRLGLMQVPRVISWSSRASETPVGVEYIVMDVADGIELASVWHVLTMAQKIALVREWVKFENRVVHAFSKGGYGSLYFRGDLSAEDASDVFLEDSDQPDKQYVLGPSTSSQSYWDEKYGIPEDMNLDLGPWPDVPSYLKSLTNCERAWISKYAKRPTRKYVAAWELPVHLQIPEEHLRLLDLYDKVAQYFIPTDQRLLRPTMTLVDSNPYNIFLSREAFLRDGTIDITSVIDWQHTTILPLYLTAHVPRFIEDSIANDGQDHAEFMKEKDYLRKAYHTLYFETDYDVAWASALSVGGTTRFPVAQIMPLAAQGCWHAGYADLRKSLIQVALDWENVAPGTACPLAAEGFTQKDLVAAREDYVAWHTAESRRDHIEAEVGLRSDDSVEYDGYDAAVQTNRELFEAWKATLDARDLDNVDPTDIWPVGQDSLKRWR